MSIDDYVWNLHEQKLKIKNGNLYSQPKIKIRDDSALRDELMLLLEELPQYMLIIWAVNNALLLLPYLDSHLQNDPRIQKALTCLSQRVLEECTVSELRNVGFKINRLAKESSTEVSKVTARCFPQAIAVGHMRGHCTCFQ